MKAELERHKRAIEKAVSGLNGIKDKWETGVAVKNAADLVLSAMLKELAPPPPEMETVEETMGWMNIYGPGEYSFEPTEEAIRARANLGKLIDCQKIKVKITRPKKQPVERSVSGEVEWSEHGSFSIPLASDHPLMSFRELIGKKGTLTFIWTEPEV